jgi:ATP-dependent protease ClpP protease subunit
MFLIIDNVAHVLIHSEVDSYMATEITAGLLWIESLPEITEVQVSIVSYGGDVGSGYAIYQALQNSSKKVTTINHGFAASIAAVIMLAAPLENRYATDYSLFMLHNPKANDTKTIAVVKASLIKILSKTFEETLLEKWMNETTWMNADEQKEWGVIKDIIYTNEDIEIDTEEISTVNYFEICNNALKNNESLKMKKVLKEVIKNEAEVIETAPVAEVVEETPATIETPTAEAEIETISEEKIEEADMLLDLKKELEEMTKRALQAEQIAKAFKEKEELEVKEEILNKAGIEKNDFTKWMKLDVETIKNLTSTLKVTKTAPVTTTQKTEIKNSINLNNLSMNEKAEMIERDFDQYYKIFKNNK